MADDKSQHEPSMEEILASIRRIIAEDNEATEGGEEGKGAQRSAASDSSGQAAEEDVLELTEVVEEEQAVANPPEAPAPNGAESEFTLGVEPEEPETSAEDRLISAASAAASVASLSQLVARPRDRGTELPLGDGNRTLEDMVRELVRPLLKTWLDENLPALVERLVHEEIARLVREAQAR